MTKRKELLFGVIVVTFCGVVIFGMAEMYFRFFNPQMPAFLRPDSVVGTMHFSNYTVTQNNACIKAMTHFNKEGMNDVDHEERKPEGVYRIAVIGDSYVEAMQFPLEQAFFRVMERKLQAQGHKVEVLAFGVGGFGTLQEYYLLRDFAFRYEPDLVVLSFLTYNDIRNNSFELEKSLDMPYAVLNESGQLEFPEFKLRKEYVQAFESPLRTLVFERSHLIRFIYRLSNQSVKFRNFLAFFHLHTPAVDDGQTKDISHEVYFSDLSQAWKDAWDVTGALISKMKDEAEKNNAQFMIFSLSNEAQLSEDNFQRIKAGYPGVEMDSEVPERRVSEIMEREGIKHFSALPSMKQLAQEGVTVHPVCHGHWSPEASNLAGEQLANYIKEEFLVR